jgi:hypothetical protein
MCLIIADNLNVQSFSQKLVILCKKSHFGAKLAFFKKISFPSIKDNVNQNMFKQKNFHCIWFYFLFFDHW